MSTGFSAADFNMIPDGDQFPLPVRQPGGWKTYTAKLMLPSRTQYNVLESYISDIEINPSMGGGALIIVVAGPGKKTLTYPAQNGVEESVVAILTDLSSMVHMTMAGYIECDASFTLVDS